MSQQQQYTLSHQNPKIVFVSGGPGSGKGTQCERLVRDYHFDHISVGDVVRDEIKKQTPDGIRFKEIAAKGDLVPDDLVVNLIIKQLKSRKSHKYLIDGFPRGIAQAQLFERKFKEIDYILNISVSDEVLRERLLSRGQTSGRADDNEEAIMNRIKTFHDSTQPVLDFYEHLGKVFTVDGSKEVDEVYKLVEQAIKPNVVFMYGPPCCQNDEISKLLADKTKYQYINTTQFSKQHNCAGDDNLFVNKLMDYIQNAPFKNFIVDSFFVEKNNAEIFFLHFTLPFKVFHFDFPKYTVNQKISHFCKGNKKELDQRLQQYEQYIKNKQDMLNLFKNQPYYYALSQSNNPQDTVKYIISQIKPLVLLGYCQESVQELQNEYIQMLEKERQFIHLNVSDQLSNEILRGTGLGNKIKAFEETGQDIPWKFQIELIEKIIFCNPIQQRRFIITNLDQNHVKHIEKEILLQIDQYVDFVPKNHSFSSQFSKQNTPLLDSFRKGKYIQINQLRLDILDFYINNRPFYGFVLGPQGCGKTTISKFIAQKFNYVHVDWEQTIEMLKVKLGGEEGPLEEVSYPQMEKYFYEKLIKEGNAFKYLFDGWPQQYTFGQFQAFLYKLGLPPQYCLLFYTEKESYTQKYKVKNEIQDLTEEDQAKIDEIFKNYQQYESFLDQVQQKNYGMDLILLKGKNQQEVQKEVGTNGFFQKKLILVNNYLHPSFKDKHKAQRKMFLNFCLQNNFIFIDLIKLQKQHYKLQMEPKIHEKTKQEYTMRNTQLHPQFPSNYTPKLIVEVIQNYLKNVKKVPETILVYGYPSGDTPLERSQNEKMFPRASDELYQLEKELGQIRMLCVLTDKQVNWQIQDEKWELNNEINKENSKVEQKKEEEEGDKPQEEENDQEKKKVFNIYEYEWTKSDGMPKTVPQWYNKIKKTIKKHVSLQQGKQPFLIGFNKLNEYYHSILDESNPLNHSQQDYNKVNIFAQFRYEQVEEETEQEPERIPFKFIEPEKPQERVLMEQQEPEREVEEDEYGGVPFPDNMQDEKDLAD